MIDRTHALPVRSAMPAAGAGSRRPRTTSRRRCQQRTLALMRRIDELHLDYPFAGARMLRDLLRREGHAIGRRHVATLMRRMGIEAAVSQAAHQPAASGPSGLPLSPARSGDLATQSCLGGGYHLHPDGARLCVFVRGPRLGQSPGVGVAAVQHADDGLLSGRSAGRPGPLWPAGDLQYRSRLPVHQPGVHGTPERTTASRSAWTAKAAGETTYSWNGSGKVSNTRRCICTPTRPSGPRTRAWSAT